MTSGRKLAVFPDGTAAAVVNDYDSGQALTLGASFTQTVLRAQVGRTFEAGREWVNSFEPSGDVITCILIHPTEATYKLAVLEKLLERFVQNVWIGKRGRPWRLLGAPRGGGHPNGASVTTP